MINKLINKYKNLSLTAKAGIWFVICSCIQSGIKFISLPIFANIMSVTEYGKVTLYTSWMSVIYIFATLALGRANGVFYVAMVKFPKDKNKFTTSMEGLTIFLCIIVHILMYVSTFIFGDWIGIGSYVYFAMCIELIGYGIMLIWSLRMRFEYKYRALLLMTLSYSVGTIIIPMIGVLICPTYISPSFMKNICSAFISLILGLVALILSIKGSRELFNANYWKFAFKFNIVLIPHYISNVILVQSDRIIIAKIINEAAAAIYNVAYTLGVAAQVITQALINAINPWMYKRISEGKGSSVTKPVNYLIMLVSVMVIGVCLVMPEIFIILFPEAYSQALSIIPPVAAGVLWAFIFNLFASIELYFSGNKFVSFASFTGAFINVVLNLLLIPIFGYYAAAYTTLICDIIYAFMHTIFSVRLLKKNMPNTELLSVKTSWGIGIITTSLCLLILQLYPYALIRYSFVIIFVCMSVIKRNHIKKILNFKAN